MQTTLGGERLHRHHLPDRQVTTAGRRPVFTHRYVLAIVHLHAIDADRGEPGDSADNTCAARTARALDRRTGTAYPTVAVIEVGTIHTFRHRPSTTRATGALLEWRAGTTDTTRPGPGTAHAAGKLHTCSTGHTHLVPADTHRRRNHLGRRYQVQPENQGERDSTEAARKKSHGPGVFDESGSVASV